ncbi:motility associated factor glycosyltransferase family protein [Butyrivibrio sp. AD3002]|uniref:motility associated factor glycosyltransferase family protein n=1 Tax=Butyrivibrio sp. AD3002 TaxID=1280670 RepID=UPI0003B54B11|nr:6-hydroxymethylpterin diphosphokinase MptE-like protein [Butyrivibrio sp. AD3002]
MTFEGKEINELHKDENLRNKNFDAFEKRYNIRPKVDPTEDKMYRIETSYDGQPVLFINGALSGGDLRINSIYSPSYEATRWAQKLEVPNRRTTTIIMGFSTGIYLRMLLDRYRPDTTFFVYEPNEALFSYVCAYADFTDIISHVRINWFITEYQINSMTNALLSEAITYRSETEKIVTPFYREDEFFKNVSHQLEAAMATSSDFQERTAREALRCRMYAWNHMDKSYVLPQLRARIKPGVAAVIVSAGPSLNKNVEVLKKIKGHAFIICTDRAASILAEHDIKPDIIITMDAGKSSNYLKIDVYNDTYLLCSYQTNSETQKLFEGRCVFFHALKYEQELIGDIVGEQDFDHGGNVAGAAYVVCRNLGIKRIILVGQDLAFIDGKHHADDKEEGIPNIERKYVEGSIEDKVETNEAWIAFRDFFERQIAMDPDISVIDATEGGAKIHGAGVKDLDEVADELSRDIFDCGKLFENLEYTQTLEEKEKTVEIIRQWICDLDEISDISKKLEAICSQLIKACKYHDINDAEYSRKRKQLGECKLKIHKKCVYELMEHLWIKDIYSIPEFVLFIRNNEEALPVLENARTFYSNLPEDCKSLKQELIASISG